MSFTTLMPVALDVIVAVLYDRSVEVPFERQTLKINDFAIDAYYGTVKYGGLPVKLTWLGRRRLKKAISFRVSLIAVQEASKTVAAIAC